MTVAAPAKKHSDKRQLTALAVARVSNAELDQLRILADARGMSVSNFLRSLVQREIKAR